jgi:hypothetical protein
MIPYVKKMFITPPRPHIVVGVGELGQLKGWLVQIKKNGTNTVIFVSPDKEVTAMTRHGAEHKAWKPTAKSTAWFKRLPGKGWYVINAELLHSKVPGIRDTHYIHDILVCDGELLLGTTYAQRYALLQRLFWTKEAAGTLTQSHVVLDENTWLVRNVRGSQKKIFESLTAPEDEGIVFKNPQGIFNLTDGKGAPWLAKCRRPKANYSR